MAMMTSRLASLRLSARCIAVALLLQLAMRCQPIRAGAEAGVKGKSGVFTGRPASQHYDLSHVIGRPFYFKNPLTGRKILYTYRKAAQLHQAALDASRVPRSMAVVDISSKIRFSPGVLPLPAHVPVPPLGGPEEVSTAFLLRRVSAMTRFFAGISTLTLELAISGPVNLSPSVRLWLANAKRNHLGHLSSATIQRLPPSQLVMVDKLQREILFWLIPREAINKLLDKQEASVVRRTDLEQLRRAMNNGIVIIAASFADDEGGEED